MVNDDFDEDFEAYSDDDDELDEEFLSREKRSDLRRTSRDMPKGVWYTNFLKFHIMTRVNSPVFTRSTVELQTLMTALL